MIEDEPPRDIPAAIDYVERRLGKQGRCPICQNADWAIEITGPLASVIGTSHAPAYILKSDETFWDKTPAIPVLVFTCTNCAFVRQHNLSWIEAEMRRSKANG